MKPKNFAAAIGHLMVCLFAIVQTVRVHRTIDWAEKTAGKFNEATTNIANAYFRAGVSSAMNAHAQYLKRELMEGRRPDWLGAPMEQWKRESYAVWFSLAPDEPLLSRPTVATNLILTNAVRWNRAIYIFPE